MLKKQIAGAFKDNSWERQLQIDELTKELKRTQDEYEMLRHKLVSLKNKPVGVKNFKLVILYFKWFKTYFIQIKDSCQNCALMLEKLEQKNSSNKEQELLLSDLMNLIRKFQSQLNINLQEDLTRISSNRQNSDLLLKLNLTNITKQPDQSTTINKTKVKNRLN